MSERPRHAWALAVALAAALAGVGGLCWWRAAAGEYDFHHFYLDARYVWQHAALNPTRDDPDPLRNRQLPFYLPWVPCTLSLLTCGGPQTAALLWALGQVAALASCLALCTRWLERAAVRGAPTCVAAAVIIASPAIYEAAFFNQLSFLVLALVLAGSFAVARGASLRGGALLGIAAALKLLPVMMLVWLALKREWRALGAAAVAAAGVSLIPPLAVLGPQRAWAAHVEWLRDNVLGPPLEGMVDPALREHFVDHRNQSIAAVLGRIAWSEHPARAPIQPLALSRDASVWLARGVMLALGVALCMAARAPARRLSLLARFRDAAAFMIAMVAFSPLLRQYYLIWALPGLAVLIVAVRADSSSTDDPRAARAIAARIGLGAWLLGMLAWPFETARVYGVHLVMLLVVAGALLASTRRSRRDCA